METGSVNRAGHARASLPVLRVAGVPEPAGAVGRGAWMDAVHAALTASAVELSGTGLVVSFFLGRGGAVPPDRALDGLVEPVVTVLLERHGWLNGRRQDVDFVVARTAQRGPAGCALAVVTTLPDLDLPAARLLHAYWGGRLPAPGDRAFADWVHSRTAAPGAAPAGALGVALHFGDSGTNLTHAAPSVVSSVVAGLRPALGGPKGAAGRGFTELVLTRSTLDGGGGVHCSVWRR